MTSSKQEAAKPADPQPTPAKPPSSVTGSAPPVKTDPKVMPKEVDGPTGPEPTRYGDWEKKGRVSDF
ncbi:DUF1674 domain-containing protein [Pseudoroseomonas globiformis]|uniref:DUF1674 domain-containing protein n=1 Tax=Teichococcus globiformis TaxID=2307229 RepID=A0ABV7FY87_9PROT